MRTHSNLKHNFFPLNFESSKKKKKKKTVQHLTLDLYPSCKFTTEEKKNSTISIMVRNCRYACTCNRRPHSEHNATRRASHGECTRRTSHESKQCAYCRRRCGLWNIKPCGCVNCQPACTNRRRARDLICNACQEAGCPVPRR